MWEELWLDGTDALSDKRYVDARRALEAAVNEARGSSSNLRVGVSLDRLAHAYAESGMESEALKTWEEAIEVFNRSLKQDKDNATERIVRKELIGSQNSLAATLILQKKYEAAEKVLNEAIQSAQLIGGADMKNTRDKRLVLDLGNCYQSLGTVYEAKNKTDDARRMYALASRNMAGLNLDAPDSKLLQSAVTGYGATASDLSGEDIARLNQMVRKWLPEHEAGGAANQINETEKAAEHYRKAFDIARQYKFSSEQSLSSLTQLLKVLNRSRNEAQSENLIRRYLPEIEKAEASKQLDNVLGEMTKTYVRQSKWAQAELILKQRLKVRESVRGPNNYHVGETLYDLGCVYLALNNLTQAEFCLRKAQKIMEYSGTTDNAMNSKIAVKLTELQEVQDTQKNRKK